MPLCFAIYKKTKIPKNKEAILILGGRGRQSTDGKYGRHKRGKRHSPLFLHSVFLRGLKWKRAGSPSRL